MLSKAKWLIITCSLLVSISCSVKVNEEPVSSDSMGLSGAETGCLTGAFSTLEAFFDGVASEEQITKLCDCASSSLKLFYERTEGVEKGKYSPEELRSFLHKYFMSDYQISDSLLAEAMVLKSAILGGSTSSLTVSDLERAQRILEILKHEMIRIKPFMPLNPDHLNSRDPVSFAAAMNAIVESARSVGGALQETAVPYSFTSLDKLLEALSHYFHGNNLEFFREKLGLFRILKTILVSPNGDAIIASEWSRLLSTSAKWYTLYLRSYYLKNYSKLGSGPGYTALESIIDDAFDLLKEAIAYHPGKIFNAFSLYALLNKLSEKDLGAPPQAVKEVFRQALLLKHAFFGADEVSITKNEIDEMHRLLKSVLPLLVPLEPYLPLSQIPKLKNKDDFVEAATATLVSVSDSIAETLSQTNGRYYLRELYKLLSSVEEILLANSGLLEKFDIELVKDLKKNLELLKALKAVFLSAPHDSIVGADWGNITRLGGRAYALGLKFAYFSETQKDWFIGRDRDFLAIIARDAKNLLVDAVMLHKKGTIAFEELDRVVDEFLPHLSWKNVPRPDTLKELTRNAVRRALGGLDRGAQGRDANGVTLGLLDRLWETFSRWYESQRFVEGVFNKFESADFLDDRTIESVSAIDAFEYTRPSVLTKSAVPTEFQIDAADGLKRAIQSHRPLLTNTSRMFFTKLPFESHSFHDLSSLNWRRQLAAVLLSGYSQDRQRAINSVGVTYEEFKQFCDDVRDFGIEIKFIDPDKYDMHDKRFREANLFTYQADGDEIFGVDEGVELLAFMVSSKLMATDMHNEIADYCESKGKLDPKRPIDKFDRPNIQANCYREVFRNNYAKFMSSIPTAISYYERLSPKRNNKFSQMFEEAARLNGYSDEPIGSADSEAFVLITHYIEALISRFDSNFNGSFDRKETDVAFLIFKRVLADYVRPKGITSENQVEALFTYMLSHSKVPSNDSVGKADFIWWMSRKPWWSFEADRTTILSIFAEIGKI